MGKFLAFAITTVMAFPLLSQEKAANGQATQAPVVEEAKKPCCKDKNCHCKKEKKDKCGCTHCKDGKHDCKDCKDCKHHH